MLTIWLHFGFTMVLKWLKTVVQPIGKQWMHVQEKKKFQNSGKIITNKQVLVLVPNLVLLGRESPNDIIGVSL